jgi:hypothetical protein
MVSRIFAFESPRGYRLSGVLQAPVATVRGRAIFARCFTCGNDSLMAARGAVALSSHQIRNRSDLGRVFTSQFAIVPGIWQTAVLDLNADVDHIPT